MTTATATDLYDPQEHDKYTYSDKFHWLQKWLWFCAGADVQLMSRCPRSEQIKEEGIGGIVLATAVLAFLSGSYAMYVVFGPKVGLALSPEQEQIHWPSFALAVVVGLIWAAVILNIDRFVVSSTGHGDGTDKITWGEFGRALPRLGMAIIIGLCLSKPLEIRVMKTEIEAELRTRQADYMNELNKKEEARFREDIAVLEKKKAEADAKVKKIDDDIRSRENNITQQRKKLDDEAGGKSPTGVVGQGPAFMAKLRNLEEMKAELDRYAASVQDEKAQLKAEAKQATEAMDARRLTWEEAGKVNAIKANNLDGLIKRIQIADDISGLAGTFLMLILIVIEVAPIFFKMMMPRGPYLSLVDNQAEIVLAREAITKELVVDPGSGSTVSHASERYHKAETIRRFEVEQLKSEQTLAACAIETNTQKKISDIQANPEKYVADESTGSRSAA